MVLLTCLYTKCNELHLILHKFTYTHNGYFSGKVCSVKNLTNENLQYGVLNEPQKNAACCKQVVEPYYNSCTGKRLYFYPADAVIINNM